MTVDRRNSRATVDWHVSFGGEWWEAKAGFCRWTFFVGSIYLFSLSRPYRDASVATDNHRTAPSACTVLFISHPYGVIYRSPLNSPTSSRWFIEFPFNGGRRGRGFVGGLSWWFLFICFHCRFFFSADAIEVPLALLHFGTQFSIVWVSRHCTFGL